MLFLTAIFSDGYTISANYRHRLSTWSSTQTSNAYLGLLTNKGEMIWEQDMGGAGDDRLNALAFVDDSVVAVGVHTAYGGEKAGLPWMVRIGHEGQEFWNTVLPKEYSGTFHDVIRTRGGVVAVGEVRVPHSTQSLYTTSHFVVAAKYTDTGELVWKRQHVLGHEPKANAIARIGDQGYFVVGSVQKNPSSSRDGFVLRLNRYGSLEWFQVYGGSQNDRFQDLVEFEPKRYVLLGTNASTGNGTDDLWTFGIDADGKSFLNVTHGSNAQHESANSLILLPKGICAFTANHLVGRFRIEPLSF